MQMTNPETTSAAHQGAVALQVRGTGDVPQQALQRLDESAGLESWGMGLKVMLEQALQETKH